jgi:hypothetical protein
MPDLPPQLATASRGIGIEDAGAAGVDGLQAKRGSVRRREALVGAREYNQALALRQARKPIDSVQVALI